MQNRGQFPALYDNVEKVVNGLIFKNVKEIKPKYPRIFPKVTLDNAKFKRYTTSAPFGDIPEKPEGSPYADDVIMQAWTKDITPVEYGFRFQYTQPAEEDDQYDELKNKARYATFAMRRVEDKAAANVLNNGFTTQLTADAVALFSTAHTLKRGGTAKNRPSADADLSYTSLVQAFIDLATDTKIESGQLAEPPNEYFLVVPPHLEMQAHRLVKSTLQAETANNDTNPLKDLRRITVFPWVDLTDTDGWFLIPASKEQNGLIYLERLGITMPPMMVHPDTLNKLFYLRCRKVWDSLDWRNSYGTVGA